MVDLTPEEQETRDRLDARDTPSEYSLYYDPYDASSITFGTWAALWQRRRRDETHWKVGKDEIGEAEVSTVWLGMDHGFGDGPPLIFETMIFGGTYSDETWCWPTREAAQAGHERIVAALRAGEAPEGVSSEPSDTEA